MFRSFSQSQSQLVDIHNAKRLKTTPAPIVKEIDPATLIHKGPHHRGYTTPNESTKLKNIDLVRDNGMLVPAYAEKFGNFTITFADVEFLLEDLEDNVPISQAIRFLVRPDHFFVTSEDGHMDIIYVILSITSDVNDAIEVMEYLLSPRCDALIKYPMDFDKLPSSLIEEADVWQFDELQHIIISNHKRKFRECDAAVLIELTSEAFCKKIHAFSVDNPGNEYTPVERSAKVEEPPQADLPAADVAVTEDTKARDCPVCLDAVNEFWIPTNCIHWVCKDCKILMSKKPCCICRSPVESFERTLFALE